VSADRAAAALVDAYNRHDLARYVALHADTARVTFANADGEMDLDAWSRVLARLFTAVPDLTVAPVTVCHGTSSAVLELRQTGTNTGPLVLDGGARALLGCELDHIPPTGRPIDTTGVVVLDVVADAIVTERHHWPPAWLYEQLGLVTVTVVPAGRTARAARPRGLDT
jgi:hypothetical protein